MSTKPVIQIPRVPVAVPTLDDLARDASRATDLPVEVTTALLARCVLVQGVLLARLLATAATGQPATPTPRARAADTTEWITADEVTRRYGLTARWLRRHRAALREARIACRPPGSKVVLYHASRLARWIEAHAGRQ
jgi:hypothetical protein